MVDTYKKMFQDARNTIDKKDEKPRVVRKEWDESWNEYIKRNRDSSRLILLSRLNPSNRCPLCEKVKVKSRQWVILKAIQIRIIGHRVVCKSCYMKRDRSKEL